MAHECSTTNCGQLIHTDRHTCNKCLGVKAKTFDKAPTKTRGATIDGQWISGNKRAARAGVADALAILEL